MIIISIISAVILIAFSSLVYSAYYPVCLNKGEKFNTYTCGSDCCKILCTKDGLYATNPAYCYDSAPCSCGYNITTDVKAPEFTSFLSPIQDKVYSDRTILIDFDLDEFANTYYDDLSDRYGDVRLCSGTCDHYSYPRAFSDGRHELVFKAIDQGQNKGEHRITFYVDSTLPKIRSTLPAAGSYINSVFTVQYDELNLVKVTLHYQNKQTLAEGSVEKTDCPSGISQTCQLTANLQDGVYDYWFALKDIADNEVNSNKVMVIVDTTPPALNIVPFQDIYDKRSVMFNISSDELIKLGYIDYSDRVPRFKILGANINYYARYQTLADAYHRILINATDRAGNYVTSYIEFLLDSIGPRIKLTEPRPNKYTNGTFTVSYDETNLRLATLYYTLDNVEYSSAKNDCPSGKNQKCVFNIDLGLIKGNLTYYFRLQDDNREAKSRPAFVYVDTIKPVLTKFQPVDGIYNNIYIPFNLTMSEKVTLEYMNINSTNPTWKVLCSNCNEYGNLRTVKRPFYNGYYDLIIRARDNAGNSDEESAKFTVQP